MVLKWNGPTCRWMPSMGETSFLSTEFHWLLCKQPGVTKFLFFSTFWQYCSLTSHLKPSSKVRPLICSELHSSCQKLQGGQFMVYILLGNISIKAYALFKVRSRVAVHSHMSVLISSVRKAHWHVFGPSCQCFHEQVTGRKNCGRSKDSTVRICAKSALKCWVNHEQLSLPWHRYQARLICLDLLKDFYLAW